uniref:Uncharacterized protein n=1 Tax=Populus trichocarpa TaxID=3694 RepID=A9P8Z5_POPTR|nr:unknown [Populus trichocarpa]
MEFVNYGSTTMLGNVTRTFQFWGKGHQNEFLSLAILKFHIEDASIYAAVSNFNCSNKSNLFGCTIVVFNNGFL